MKDLGCRIKMFYMVFTCARSSRTVKTKQHCASNGYRIEIKASISSIVLRSNKPCYHGYGYGSS